MIHLIRVCGAVLLCLALFVMPVLATAEDEPAVRHAYFFRTSGESVADLRNHADILFFGLGEDAVVEKLRQSGYRKPILVYFLAAELEGPSNARSSEGGCDAQDDTLWHNSVTYEVGLFCREVHPNESWFLHNSRGERLRVTQGGWGGEHHYYYMNIGNPDYQRWMIDRLGDALAHEGRNFDGLWLDNVELSLEKVNDQLGTSTGSIQEYDTDAAYRSAWLAYLKRLRASVNAPIWGNLIADPVNGSAWDDYMPYLDGAMAEHFAVGWPGSRFSTSKWKKSLDQAEKALDAGKSVAVVVQGDRNSNELKEFGMASYLLIANDRAYFRYSQYADYGDWHRTSEDDFSLGAPKGKRYQLSDGRWRRDFASGTVIVDGSARTAVISGKVLPDATPQPTPTRTATPSPDDGKPTATPRPGKQPTATPTATPKPGKQPTPTVTPLPTPTATPPPTEPVTYTLSVLETSQISKDDPHDEQGLWDKLKVDGVPRYAALVKFRIGNIREITRVSLRMYVLQGGHALPTAQRTTLDWSDDEVTWDGQPDAFGPIVSTGDSGASTGKWVTLDLSELVTDDHTYSVRLSLKPADDVTFASNNSAYPPVLVVEGLQ